MGAAGVEADWKGKGVRVCAGEARGGRWPGRQPWWHTGRSVDERGEVAHRQGRQRRRGGARPATYTVDLFAVNSSCAAPTRVRHV